MSEPITELPPEDPPDPEQLLDAHDILDTLTEDEQAEGKRLGEMIDTEDDLDNGGFE